MADGDKILSIESTAIYTPTSNTTDLGKSTLKFKNGYFAGNIYSAGRLQATVVKSSGYTLGSLDELVVFSSATGITAILPASIGTGRKYMIKSINTGTIVIDPNGTDTIENVSNEYVYQDEAVQIMDFASGKWAVV